MATHSSVLAWRISWTEGPGGLPSMELQRVGHNLATNTHTQPKYLKNKLYGSSQRFSFNVLLNIL